MMHEVPVHRSRNVQHLASSFRAIATGSTAEQYVLSPLSGYSIQTDYDGYKLDLCPRVRIFLDVFS